MMAARVQDPPTAILDELKKLRNVARGTLQETIGCKKMNINISLSKRIWSIVIIRMSMEPLDWMEKL
ncbi:unnamed protein product [Caenorhabditis brenneri]